MSANGVNLLPASGEWVYDTTKWRLVTGYDGAGAPSTFEVVNFHHDETGASGADFGVALDQLAARLPGCETVALICAWFGSSLDASVCKVYPSTVRNGSLYADDAGRLAPWLVSSVKGSLSPSVPTPNPIVIPISTTADGHAVYGGTPSDPSVVRCIQELKRRGYKVAFYPFLLMDCLGFPWRGRIGLDSDLNSAASAAVAHFLGTATPSAFTRDAANLTVAYVGPTDDYTYRRMILHYANLCVMAGGVDLFFLGSEFRGLETLRGPGWTKAGTIGTDGRVTWDYPFVDGLCALADDVRSVFDGAGLARDAASLKNLIAYSADWSVWMGYQHSGAAGQWPHLDQLYAYPSIDLVSFDNYLPLSDWTTADDGLDTLLWDAPAPTSWPPGPDTMSNLGLTGEPTLYSIPYLKANIEGGEKFDWFYYDSENLGRGLDPLGSDRQVSLPEGDRLTQTRSRYYPGQEILANKQIRWWWKNPHRAVYDAGDGQGYAPHGPATKWVPQSKSIIFAEYGFPTIDRCTNQPNVFYDPKSTESFTAYWSVWQGKEGTGYQPLRDDTLSAMAQQALYEYWFVDGLNETSTACLPMVQKTFTCLWCWDARPFPVFPLRDDIWGDTNNWVAGHWLGGKGPSLPPPPPDAVPAPGPYPPFPALSGEAWSVTYTPRWSTGALGHVSGRESRAARWAHPLWDVTLSFDMLRAGALGADLETLAGFFAAMQAEAAAFTVPAPLELGTGGTLLCRFADDDLDLEEFMALLFATQSFKIQGVRA